MMSNIEHLKDEPVGKNVEEHEKAASKEKLVLSEKSENPRLIRKKRTHYNSVSHTGTSGISLSTEATISGPGSILGNRAPYGKNSRKARNGFRHAEKKATDRDLWDFACDEMEELELDPNDPDYESPEEIPEAMVLSDEDFDQRVSALLHQYYAHCKPDEFIDSLMEIAMTSMQRRRLPVLAINIALQHKLGHCELTSELLSAMCGTVISMSGMQQSFRLLLDEMPDIVLDVPKAPDYIGRFIARAVADDILPPKFVQQCKAINAAMPPAGTPPNVSDTVHPPVRIASRHNSSSISESVGVTSSSSGVSSACDYQPPSGDESGSYALQAIKKAEELLTSSRAYRHLDSVWGVHPNERVTTMLMKQIYALIIQFIRDDGLEAVVSELNNLDSPHFHHEVVYQIVIIALQYHDNEEVRAKMLFLLKQLCNSVVVSYDQLVTGVRRVYADLPIVQKEIPIAYVLLQRFMADALKEGFMPQKLVKELPKNPRKRYVSEGDAIRKSAAVDNA